MAKLFGTGGIRAKMGDFPGAFGEETVEKATQGLADWVRARQPGVPAAIAIAYDTRNQSREFAELAAAVLRGNGIRALLFQRPTPTPVLSFAVRYLGCAAGIVITASHNTKEYNGYKVYNRTGCQLVPHEAEALSARIEAAQVASYSLEGAEYVSQAVDEAYLAAVKDQSLWPDGAGKASLRLVYTPLHGAGDWFVREVLARDGFSQVQTVAAQQVQDGNFPTVKSPNPEDRDALNLAIETAGQDADIVLGTDPDCDRVGAAVLHRGEWQLISGNQMGALLLDFILKQKKNLPANGAVVKTIVTSNLGAAIAKKAGLAVFETLTGFKYIGEMMDRFEETGAHTFVFGYEESYGYLAGTYARDKDAVVSSQLIGEMAAWHKAQRRTLVDALELLYQDYGYYLNALETLEIEDVDKVSAMMEGIRQRGGAMFTPSAAMKDYQAGIDGLPPENVLKFSWPDGSWAAIRPSGTEPKVKVYYEIRAENREAALARKEQIAAVIAL